MCMTDPSTERPAGTAGLGSILGDEFHSGHAGVISAGPKGNRCPIDGKVDGGIQGPQCRPRMALRDLKAVTGSTEWTERD